MVAQVALLDHPGAVDRLTFIGNPDAALLVLDTMGVGKLSRVAPAA